MVVEPEVVTVTVMVVMLVVLVRLASLSAVVDLVVVPGRPTPVLELVVVLGRSTEVEVQGGEAAVVSHELVRDVEKLDQRFEYRGPDVFEVQVGSPNEGEAEVSQSCHPYSPESEPGLPVGDTPVVGYAVPKLIELVVSQGQVKTNRVRVSVVVVSSFDGQPNE